MKNINFDSSVERMKQLMNHGEQDAKLKANVSETVEYKVNGPDGNTYGIVREKQKYFIKESKDGVEFNYIGGIGNRSENEYPSYNSAYRNLELKVRSLNESLNNGKTFEVLPADTNSEYIVEATKEMRSEIDRQRQIMMGAAKIMNESNEFINKPKFKDPEGFGAATDPKKQGDPFKDAATAKLEKDPNFKATDAKKQGDPFKDNAKAKEDKFDIEKTNDTPENAGEPFTVDAKDVLGNSVATKKPKGGKVIKISESQLKEVRKRLSEGMFEEEPFNDEEDLYIPNGITFDDDAFDDDAYNDDAYNGDDEDYTEELAFPIPSEVKYTGNNDKWIKTYGDTFEYVGQTPEGLSYVVGINKNTGREVELEVPTIDLERIRMHESVGKMDDEEINEGLWDAVKGVGSVGKYFGGQASGAVKQGVQAVGQKAQAVGQKAQAVGQKASQIYNQSQAQSSQSAIDKIANTLKNELINLNNRTVKSGGQPLNYNSVLTALSNKLRGQLKNTVTTESVDENLVSEITEAVLNAFGQHPTYQKPAFTTSSADGSLKPGTHEWDDESVKGQAPYGQKIGSSAPFTNPVKQKVGEGEIGEDAGCDTIKGKTQQGNSNLGQKGDKAPFTKPVEKSGDKIAKGTSVQKGETQQETPNLGQKGDKAPFTKPVKKSEVLNKLAESIIADLKKK